ncbi:MAG: hypothetical protein SD837_19160 [Candidatus Electrothrix scaldis]|nr:MAG: hypothetical protein SD837_19160 [Candidatus Electrothrix sp. GW3-3]
MSVSLFFYVLYAGSHEGCGCGFIKEGEVGEQLEMVQSNYKQLASYLQKLRTSGYNIEIFVCWEGGQGAEPELRQRINVETLVMEGFEFQEKTYYEIE